MPMYFARIFRKKTYPILSKMHLLKKKQWAMQLRRSGYIFSQVGDSFLVHYPHLDSTSRLEWNKKPGVLERNPGFRPKTLGASERESVDWEAFKRARVDALFLEFREWMEKDVRDESRISMCEDAQDDDNKLWVGDRADGGES